MVPIARSFNQQRSVMKLRHIILLSALALIILPGCDQSRGRYQVASYGNAGAIIIDTETGEAWIMEGEAKGKNPYRFDSRTMPCTNYFTPAHYWSQDLETNHCRPDKTRNNNADWWTWLKRSFNKTDQQ